MQRITNEKAACLLEKYESTRIFKVTFIKRTDGSIRTMLCRKGVGKFVRGTGKKRDDAKHNILTVFDLEAFNAKVSPGMSESQAEKIGQACYRSINLENIIEIQMDGLHYRVNDAPMKQFLFSWFSKGTAMARAITARTEDEAKVSLRRELGTRSLPRGLTLE